MPRNPSIGDSIRHPALLTYLIGANNYTWVQFRGGKRVLLSKSLTYFSEQLPDFIRIHKTALINPAFVTDLLPPLRPKMAGAVRMQDGTVLPVGRRRWIDVANVLQQHLSSATTPLVTPPPVDVEQPADAATRTVVAVAAEDALQLLRQIFTPFEPQYALQEITVGTALPEWLLLNQISTWPALIILDARANPTDRFLTLQALKRHDRLRAIPVVWLIAPGEETNRAYALNANSVVVVRNEPAQFTAVVERLCRYWLTTVHLPTAD